MNTSKYSHKALLTACWWGIFEIEQHDNPHESTLVDNECCLVLAWSSKTILTWCYPKNSSIKEPISWLATLSKTSSMNGKGMDPSLWQCWTFGNPCISTTSHSSLPWSLWVTTMWLSLPIQWTLLLTTYLNLSWLLLHNQCSYDTLVNEHVVLWCPTQFNVQ